MTASHPLPVDLRVGRTFDEATHTWRGPGLTTIAHEQMVGLEEVLGDLQARRRQAQLAAPIPRDVRDLFPGRTFDALTQCWVAPGEKPIAAETMISYQAILEDLRLRVLRARVALQEPPSFECPVCHAVSYNPGDIEHRYCGRCHAFTGDRILGGGTTL
jgi:hypothetical protein